MLLTPLLLTAALGDPVELSVTTSELGELDEAVREQVTARLETTASDLEHPLADTAEHQLSVTIEWVEGSKTDFLVLLATSYQERSVESNSFECKECNATELLELTETQSRSALERLFESTQARPEQPPTPAPVSPAPQPPSPPPPSHKLGALGWAGIGSLSVGVAGVAAGAVFLSLGQARLKSDPTSLRDFRPAGYTALAVGGVGLVAGTVLVVLDRRRARRRASAQRRMTPSASGFQMHF